MTGDRTRRNVVRTVCVGSATVTVPSFVDVVSGATDSGEVEVKTTSTQPSGTSISIKLFEDTDGDGTANSQQEESISAGTDVDTIYSALSGSEGQGNDYWMTITLETTNDSNTPELDSATVTLPESGGGGTGTTTSDDAQTADELWHNPNAVVAFTALVFGVIGMWGRSLTLGAFLAYLAFAHITVTATGMQVMDNIFYATLVLVFVGFAFKLWRIELAGE